jgi:hypothetical protein
VLPHATHTAIALAIISGVVFTLGSVRSRVQREEHPGADHHTNAQLTVATTSLLAGVIHILVISEHFDESALYGTFFTVLGVVQVAYAVAVLVRPARALLALGALGNAAVVVLWLITRTAGIPLGPEAGEVEAVGALDLVSSIAEVLLVVAAVVAIRQAAILYTAQGSRDSSSLDMQVTSMASASATIDESR